MLSGEGKTVWSPWLWAGAVGASTASLLGMAALQLLDWPAPQTQLPCCTCDGRAKRKWLFLRSVFRTVSTKNGL